MTSNLTERYILATEHELPSARRGEIIRELRASINDEVEGRVAVGESHKDAEFAVIEKLGDPIRLAARYSGKPLALVGPDAYAAWRRLLGQLMTVVVPLIAILAAVGAIADDASVIGVLATAVGASVGTAIQLAFWVTLVYALLERRGVFDREDLRTSAMDTWAPDDLPELPTEPRVTRGEAAGEVITGVMLLSFLAYQKLFFRIDGDLLPILNPGLWRFWIPLISIGILVGMIASIVASTTDSIPPTHTWVQLAASTITALPVIWLSTRDELLNPEFVDRFAWLTNNVDRVNTGVVLVAILVWAIEVFETLHRARRTQISVFGA